nr:bifunctional 5,10-methylenetetrahydrofolate dehydrogenase/5,10-methenyltetrahydrofolate cyclohydrolase [uncultured Peptostreptococcus sp.]
MKELNVMEYVDKEYEKLRDKSTLLNSQENGSEPIEFTIFQTGNNPASNKYVENKVKRLKSVGIDVDVKKYVKLDIYSRYNLIRAKDHAEHFKKPYLVQLPISDKAKDIEKNLLRISYDLDVDGLSLESKERFYTGQKAYIPCTARGIRDYMKHIDPSLSGKSVLIINRSDLVGRPLQKLLLDEDMLVSVAHSKVSKEKLINIFKDYDYIVSGVGLPRYFKATEIPSGCTFIDVGISFDENGKMCGDLDTTMDCDTDFSYTPVPRGVGQLTVLSLAKNIMEGC